MEGKKEIKISLGTVICIFIIFVLIIALLGMWYYNNKNIVNNSNKISETKNDKQEEIENRNEANELNLNSELITELYSYIPVISSNKIEENAYQSNLVTKEDLETEYLLACAFKKLNLLDNQKQPSELVEEWYTFDAEILQEKVKQIYGEKLENKSFDIGYGKGCSYENGKYLYGFGGGSGERVYSIRKIQKAYQEDDNLYIEDRYMIFKSDVDTSKAEIYNASDDRATLIANLDFEKTTSMENEKLEKELIMQYENEMQIYKHTFKKNDNGEYYWYSTEPIISEIEEKQIEEIAKAFVKAVNEKDWEIVEKYSSAQIVNDLKKYNVSNMSIDFSTLEKSPNNSNVYYYYDSYDIDYNGLSVHDLSMGRLFCIDKVNGEFVVSTFCATGL